MSSENDRGVRLPRMGERIDAGRRRAASLSGGSDSRAMAFRVEAAHDIAACAATVPIQEEIWSGDVVVPPQMLLAVAHNGGFVALGYVDGDERAAGFVFGFVGIYDYHFRHHSHMLALRAAQRSSGLAVALKEAQRDHCLDQGIDTIAWTMDPLEARNARFNFAKLGAFAATYHRDFYGAMPDRLNEGLASDRIYVEWRIATDRADRRLRGVDPIPSLEDAEREGVPYLLRADGDRPAAEDGPVEGSHLLMEIPADFQALKSRDLGLAREWRLAARAALEPAFASGYALVEFLRAADGRGAYVLVRRPATAGLTEQPGSAGAEPPGRTDGGFIGPRGA